MVLPIRRHRVLRALSRPRPGVAISAFALIAVWVVSTTHGPFSAASIGDLFVYDTYHDMMHVDGLVPYRDFEFEYPPGALLPIWLVGGDFDQLSALMLLCALVCLLSAWAIGGARAGWAIVALPPVAGALVRTHFDLLPTAITMVALAVIVRRPGRWPVELAFGLLAAGTLTKLWPAAVAVVAFAWLVGRGERAAAVRSAIVFAAVALAIAVPFAALGGFPSTMVRFHMERPVQIESTAATILELAGGTHVTGAPITLDPYKSNGLDGGPADLVLALCTLALLLVGAGLAALTARRRDVDAVILGAFAIAIAFVALGKVLSPQYFCWLLPLAAIAWTRGAAAGALLVATASFVTQVWFPTNYFDVVHQRWWAVLAVGVRNALLLLALAATARALARSPLRAGASPRTG